MYPMDRCRFARPAVVKKVTAVVISWAFLGSCNGAGNQPSAVGDLKDRGSVLVVQPAGEAQPRLDASPGSGLLEARTEELLGPFANLGLASTHWHQRDHACAAEDCRKAVAQERERRLGFALGKAVGPIAGIPWRSGAFILNSESRFGRLSVLPLENGSILVYVQTVSPDPYRDCEMNGYGEPSSDGRFAMHWLDDPGRLGDFALLVRNSEELRLEPRARHAVGPCSLAHPWGDYRVEGQSHD
jgi:hypothetical protein